MIVFPTEHLELYNYIVHIFLKKEIFDDNANIEHITDMYIGDMIEGFIPKYLFREQYSKCIEIFKELYYWTEDVFYHQMSAFHEVALYQFIDYMADLREEIEQFDSIYFDETSHTLIKTIAQQEYNDAKERAATASSFDLETEDVLSLEEYCNFYYDVFYYPDLLFTDLDFKLIPTLYNRGFYGDVSLEKYMGINIDFYFDILPLDIQKQYQTGHITLTQEVSTLLEYIESKVRHGNLYKLFWENGKPVKEDRIQLIIENIMDAYFYNQEIDITREALLGNGQVDFKLYKNNKEDEKILIEIKKANNPKLKKGYEKQLTDYMLSSKYKNAFYLIACFNDEEYERVLRFIREHIYTDTIQLYINISILDLRIRKTASLS